MILNALKYLGAAIAGVLVFEGTKKVVVTLKERNKQLKDMATDIMVKTGASEKDAYKAAKELKKYPGLRELVKSTIHSATDRLQELTRPVETQEAPVSAVVEGPKPVPVIVEECTCGKCGG